MLKNNIFADILKGKIKVNKVFEDDLVLSFFDIAPVNKGHSLVIPKIEHESITSLPEEFMARMMIVSSKIGKALMRLDEYDGFNLHLNNGDCAGQTVPHAHIHVIPRVGNDNFSFSWRALQYSSQEEINDYLGRIKAKI